MFTQGATSIPDSRVQIAICVSIECENSGERSKWNPNHVHAIEVRQKSQKWSGIHTALERKRGIVSWNHKLVSKIKCWGSIGLKKRGLNEYLEIKLKLHIKAASVLKPQIIFDMVFEIWWNGKLFSFKYLHMYHQSQTNKHVVLKLRQLKMKQIVAVPAVDHCFWPFSSFNNLYYSQYLEFGTRFCNSLEKDWL